MKRPCRICGQRPAKFSRHGIVKADKQHDICMQCFRSAAEAIQQRQRFEERV